MYPTYDGLMSTCRRYESNAKKTGRPKVEKDNLKAKFQTLGKKQLENGCLTYADMKAENFPLGELF